MYEAESNLAEVNYTWKIIDGNITKTQSGDRVLVQWTTDGPYKVELQQLDLSGLYCLSPAIGISPQKISTITFIGKDESCIYDEYVLEATYYESLTYDWTISPSDAATIIKGENGKVSLQLSKVGTHSIILTSCSGVYSKSVTVYALPEPVVIHPTFLCEEPDR
ncbi:MAG: hypothetical protein IPO92_16930 [Saprospiraceae bacterium]|nr:hypothetical protein [Saprospiraceae bacterium]